MARIVFFNIPAHGHVNPTLPVAQALVRQGHEVIYYDSEEFRSRIAPTGVTFRAFPEPMPSSNEISALLSDGNIANITLLLLRISDQMMPFVLGELQSERPDAVVHDSIALWGSIGANLLGLPSVASFTHFIFDGTNVKPSLREFWFILRKALPLLPEGLRLRQRLIRRFGKDIFQKDHLLPVRGDLNILFTSEALQPPSTWIDDSFRFVGPSIDTTTRETDEADSASLGHGPLIYVSLGTVHSTNTAFYRQVFDAFVAYPAQFIVSVGQHTDISGLGPIPENFIVRNQVAQLDVLQHVDMFITHGGMNSIHEGLYYGVPLIMVPHQSEQALNARVVESAGAGVMLGGRAPFGRVSSAELYDAVEHVRTDERFSRQAHTIGEKLQTTGGYLLAAEEITAFANQSADSHEVLITPG